MSIYFNLPSRLFVLSLPILFCATPIQAAPGWSLHASVQRALQLAPELRGASAEIGVREGEAVQARAWPNPEIGVRVDNKLALEQDSGGYDLTQIAISQALPWRRSRLQGHAAASRVEAARANSSHQRLLLEYETARLYHELQLTEARLRGAEERLAATAQGSGKKKGEALVRYLTPLERIRLDILRETARQSVASAEGEYGEARSQFLAYLGLAPTEPVQVEELTAAALPAPLPALLQRIALHPALVAAQDELHATQIDIDAARTQRLGTPVLSLYRERDFIGGTTRDINGVGMSIALPFSNQQRGRDRSAQAAAAKAQAAVDVQARDLPRKLQQSYVHAEHLLKQAEHFRQHVLIPAQTLFTRTRAGYNAGESNLLTLIDAHGTYYDAQARYYELLQQGWLEVAALRLAAGLSLLDATETKP